MLFSFSTPELIRHLWQLKRVVFLHWCLICAVLFRSPWLGLKGASGKDDNVSLFRYRLISCCVLRNGVGVVGAVVVFDGSSVVRKTSVWKGSWKLAFGNWLGNGLEAKSAGRSRSSLPMSTPRLSGLPNLCPAARLSMVETWRRSHKTFFLRHWRPDKIS